MSMRFIILIIFSIPGLLFSQYERPGSTLAEFLNIGVNARAEAMSGAYISVANGVEAAYYNPAALGELNSLELTASYTNWFAGIQHEYLAISKPVGQLGTLAFSAIAMHTGEMIVRTPLQPDGTGETFYAGSYRFGLSFARALTNHVYLGVSGNFIRIQLHTDFVENAYSGDVAVLFRTGVRDFRFGLSILNFGSEIQFVNEPYPLPTSFSFGVSGNVFESGPNTVLFSAAANKPNDGGPQPMAGLEYGFQKLFFLRGGYTFDDVVKTYSFGAGLKISLGSYILTGDYSYNDFSDLGGAQRLTLGFKF